MAAGLLEAVAMLADRGGRVVVIFADESSGDQFGLAPFEAFAAAVHLTSERGISDAWLSAPRLLDGPPDEAASAKPRVNAANPCAPILALFEAIERRRAGPVELFSSRPWCVELHLEEPVR